MIYSCLNCTTHRCMEALLALDIIGSPLVARSPGAHRLRKAFLCKPGTYNGGSNRHDYASSLRDRGICRQTWRITRGPQEDEQHLTWFLGFYGKVLPDWAHYCATRDLSNYVYCSIVHKLDVGLQISSNMLRYSTRFYNRTSVLGSYQ